MEDLDVFAERVGREWGAEIEWDAHAETVGILRQFLDRDAPKNSFEVYLDTRRSAYPAIQYYHDHGSWRTVDTDAISESKTQELLALVPNRVPNSCYYNAQTALVPELEYVEGYAINSRLSAAVPHAWLEYNGLVLEITPSIAKDTQHYYGVQFDSEVVADVMMETGQADPIVEWVLENRTG